MRKKESLARSKSFRDFFDRSAIIHKENCEYEFDDKGNIVGGKAPNHKKIREFYKNQEKIRRLRGKK